MEQSFSPFPCYLTPLRLKYCPQYLILIHPQPTFLPQREGPPLLNNRHIYSYVLLIFKFLVANWKTKDECII